jgi:hypothetical protein
MSRTARRSTTGNNTFWIRLDPNVTRYFQADLMEVYYEP